MTWVMGRGIGGERMSMPLSPHAVSLGLGSWRAQAACQLGDHELFFPPGIPRRISNRDSDLSRTAESGECIGEQHSRSGRSVGSRTYSSTHSLPRSLLTTIGRCL